MKNIKINILTLYFLFLFFICGLIKDALIIFFIVLIHELGHVMITKLFKYEIISINIYPFGGFTKIKKDLNTSINKDFFIGIGGFLFQIILGIVIFYLYKNHLIRDYIYDLFFKYNIAIFLFNLIPIIPLDGSNLMELILNKFCSFKTSYYLNLIFSIIFLLIFIIINYIYSFNNYLIWFFLLFKITEHYKNGKYVMNKFYLERYLKNYDFKKIKNEYNLDITKLQKENKFYFWDKDKWLSEKKILAKRFDKYD